MEIWKDIIDFEGLYKISNIGRVKSLTRYVKHSRGGKMILHGRILKQIEKTNGYMLVGLNKNSKGYKKHVHRLVAEAFIPNPYNKPQVNHKDLNKKNNTLNNLEWVSSSENIKHSYKNGNRKSPKSMLGKFGKDHHLSISVVQLTKLNEFIKSYDGVRVAERNTNIDRSCIIKACKGIQKTAGGYKWMYKTDYHAKVH